MPVTDAQFAALAARVKALEDLQIQKKLNKCGDTFLAHDARLGALEQRQQVVPKGT